VGTPRTNGIVTEALRTGRGELLGPIAAAGPPWLADLFATFVRRTDITLPAFGWSIVEAADGPAYQFAWPRWTPPPRTRRTPVAKRRRRSA
jgi:hypothetical protein